MRDSVLSARYSSVNGESGSSLLIVYRLYDTYNARFILNENVYTYNYYNNNNNNNNNNIVIIYYFLKHAVV